MNNTVNICEKCKYYEAKFKNCYLSDHAVDASRGCEFFNKDLSDMRICTNCEHYRLLRDQEMPNDAVRDLTWNEWILDKKKTCLAGHRPYTMALCLACDEFVKSKKNIYYGDKEE